MDEPLSTVSAGPRPPTPARPVRPGRPSRGRRTWRASPRAVRRCSRARGFSPWPLVLAALALWLGWSPLLRAAETYLPLVGPTLLRFAPVPAAHFAWPAPAARTNAAPPSPVAETRVANASGTNDLFLGPTWEEFLAQTNRPSVAGPAIELSAESPPAGTAGSVGSPLSASELLVVTPQMLAEYLKSPPGGTNPPPLNALPGGELDFQPPVAVPPPSSKATYRLQ